MFWSVWREFPATSQGCPSLSFRVCYVLLWRFFFCPLCGDFSAPLWVGVLRVAFFPRGCFVALVAFGATLFCLGLKARRRVLASALFLTVNLACCPSVVRLLPSRETKWRVFVRLYDAAVSPAERRSRAALRCSRRVPISDIPSNHCPISPEHCLLLLLLCFQEMRPMHRSFSNMLVFGSETAWMYMHALPLTKLALRHTCSVKSAALRPSTQLSVLPRSRPAGYRRVW